MLNYGGSLKIIFIYSWFKCVLKGLWTCVQSFEKTCWPVSDQSTSRQIDMTRATACINNRNPNPNQCIASKLPEVT